MATYLEFIEQAQVNDEIIVDESYTDRDDECGSDYIHPAEIRRRREDFARSRASHQARAHGAIDTRHLYVR